MKRVIISLFIFIFTIPVFAKPATRIFLYGEEHKQRAQYEYEVEQWQKYYNQQHMRHLFIEMGYSTGQLLNQWIKADNDQILEMLYSNWEGTAAHTQDNFNFYKAIKEKCPETIFHGTDVGHQYQTNDSLLLKMLEDAGQTDSEQYSITQENIEQAKLFYVNCDPTIRESFMVKNFLREFSTLDENEKIMGIYGDAHVSYKNDISDQILSMRYQLEGNLGKIIKTYSLASMRGDLEPLEIVEKEINGKTYKASYFGEEDISGFKNYLYRRFWRIEDAEQDFKKFKATPNCLPFDNFPVLIHKKDIYMLEYVMDDGTSAIYYYRNDGKKYQNMGCLNEIIIK